MVSKCFHIIQIGIGDVLSLSLELFIINTHCVILVFLNLPTLLQRLVRNEVVQLLNHSVNAPGFHCMS